MDEAISFGGWLRQRREALDLTREELARRVGCATITLRKIESDERRPSKQVAELLAAHLGVAEDEREAFVRFARGQADIPPAPSTHTAPWRAPRFRWPHLPAPATPLVGREEEVVELKRLLTPTPGPSSSPDEQYRQERGQGGEVRLLTLTGVGGIGKTRLALEVAAELSDTFQDGVRFVDLSPLNTPNLIPSTIAQALGVRESAGRKHLDSLKEYLRERQMLLVLDNFEQVITGAAVLLELLAACARLQLLVTSREVLHLPLEQEFGVSPLALPNGHGAPSAESLAQYPSVELFVQRALAVRPDFALTDQNASWIAKICRALEGIPLAIELAAARVKALTVRQIAVRLHNRFRLLTGGEAAAPRHQTLRAAIDWSYDLLSQAERTLLRRLSVFVGGWSLEAAEQVTGDEVTCFARDE